VSYWQAYRKVLKTNMTVLGFIVFVVAIVFAYDKAKKELPR